MNIPELLADYVWTYSSAKSQGDFQTVVDMRDAPTDVRRALCRVAGLSRTATDEEWREATAIIAKRVRYRRELARVVS